MGIYYGNRVFVLGWAGEIGGLIILMKIYAGFGEQGGEVVTVAQRRASNMRSLGFLRVTSCSSPMKTLVDTVMFQAVALTGADAGAEEARSNASCTGSPILTQPLVALVPKPVGFLVQRLRPTILAVRPPYRKGAHR